jgi:hypothetical protein
MGITAAVLYFPLVLLCYLLGDPLGVLPHRAGV